MIRRKKLLSAVLAVAMTASMAACGSAEEKGGTQAAETQAKQPAAETAAAGEAAEEAAESTEEQISLSIAWWGGQTRHDYTQQLLDLYTQSHPNVTFETSPSGWDGYFDKLATQAAAGAMPDIVQMDYLYIATYANNGSVIDLQPFVDNGTIDASNIDEAVLGTGKIGDSLAGMVLSNSILALTYNPDVLAEAEVETPATDWTWTDYAAAWKQIHEKTGAYGIETNLTDNINVLNYYVRQRGEKLFSDDNKSLGYADDAVFVDYINMITELVDCGAMPNPDEYAQISTLPKESFPVVTGDAGFRNDWNNYAVIAEGTNDKLKLMTPPMADDGTKALWVKPGMFFSVSSTASEAEQQAAAEFINWFVNSEEANAIIMAERGVPVSSEIRSFLADSGKMTPKQVEMFEYVDLAVPVCAEVPAPDPAGISEVTTAFQDAVYNVLYGRKTAEEAAAAFRTTADEILARNN